ncbi:MAG TPA: CHAT domain-containing protein [Dermatophilaceae bacterium]|nr:CHAT domain-containing protein [Dermatophilaceae bacterium]
MWDFDAAAEALASALGALDGASGADADRLRVRALITGSWTQLEIHGQRAALAMLHGARARATELGDRHLVALSRVQEGVIRIRGGDWGASLAALDAVRENEDALTPPQRCAFLINRGMAHLGLGHSADAERDLTVAAEVAAAHGLSEQEFKARHDLACVAFVDGDLPRALRLMRAADGMAAAVPRERARLDYADVLIEAGLVDRAREALDDALGSARAAGHRPEEGDISARLARCDLLVDELDGARRHIRDAMTAYRSRQLDELLRDAALISATIDVAAGERLESVVAELARRNDSSPPASSEDRAAMRLEAEAHLLLGDVAAAERRLTALPRTTRDSLAARLQDTLVRARLDQARGRHGEAERRITIGNRLLAAYQFQSSSLDVRAALALHGGRLAAFDIQCRLTARDPDAILTSVERWRAISHRTHPVTTASDPELTTMTQELRRLRRLRQLAPDGDDRAAAAARTRMSHLEDSVAEREWSLTVRASAPGVALPIVDAEEVRAAAAARAVTVVEFFESGLDLLSIVLHEGRLEVVRVGALPDIAGRVTRLRRDLRARALVRAGSPMEQVLARATASSLAALDATLNPTRRNSSRVVVVPSGSLSTVPWSLLPSLHGRPVTVAPSLTRWVRGPSRKAVAAWRDPVAAFYGPGLSHTEPEIRAIRAYWSGAAEDRHLGPASSEEVLEALGRARVVHLAAHGSHEPQSPLFSSVQMSDGPVFAHEFPRQVTAEHVALAACDVGQFSTRPGDEPLGLTVALMALGARSVLAAVAPVADAVAADAMVDYHRLLVTGMDAAAAWACVVEARPAAGVFCVYGSDWSAEPQLR